MTTEEALPPMAAPKPMSWANFLCHHPPDAPPVTVLHAAEVKLGPAPPITPIPSSGAPRQGGTREIRWSLKPPVWLQLYCPTARLCEGPLIFDHSGSLAEVAVPPSRCYSFTLRCRNCKKSEKLFVVLARLADPDAKTLEAVKLGEWPPFGERVPERAIRLVAGERSLFLQGRKSENRGLGIGALTYYRRVIGSQKERIVEEILEVATSLGAPAEMLADLEWARKAWRFEDAIDRIKGAIPAALLIEGHNPLVLLHGALSEGIHDLSDADCLARASDIRLVLTALAEKMESAMQDRTDLRNAVKRLAQRRSPPSVASNDQDPT